MKYSKQVWDQLKSLTAKELSLALLKDGWKRTRTVGAVQAYRHSDGRIVAIHIHPSQKHGYGPKLLKGLLADIAWSERDLRRLNLHYS